MNTYHRTLWMGNIEPWMNHTFLNALLNSINIFPRRTIVKNPSNKRGCEFIRNNFNGKIINNFELKFNWVKSFEEKYSSPKITKFTVSVYFYIIL